MNNNTGRLKKFFSYSWKQIADNSLEQRNVLREKFRKIDINDSLENENGLVHVWVLALEVATCTEDGHDSAHSVVVVRLVRELLAAQCVPNRK